MCGIAGYFVTDPRRVQAETLQRMSRELLLGIENRGRDATGYAYVSLRDKSVYLAKAPLQASEFLKVDGHILTRKGIQKMPRAMLLHTRAATQGSPNNNKNNHPIYTKASGLCMIHNGWISNDDMLLQEHKLSQDAEVDSEVYLRLIEKYYLTHPAEPVENGIREATSQVYGSVACAMIQAGRTDTMWIWKDQGALVVARTDWGLVFASTKSALLDAILSSHSSFDLGSLRVREPNKGSLITFNKKRGLSTNEVSAADWQKLPDSLTNRVFRTFVGDKLTSVRRARGNTGGTSHFTHSGYVDDGEYWEDHEAWEEWNRHNARRNIPQDTKPDKPVHHYYGRVGSTSAPGRSIHLPEFSRGGPAIENSGTPKTAAQEEYEKRYKNALRNDLPKVDSVCRGAVEEIAKNTNSQPPDCFCSIDYCCMRCGSKFEYFGINRLDIEREYNAH